MLHVGELLERAEHRAEADALLALRRADGAPTFARGAVDFFVMPSHAELGPLRAGLLR